MIRMKLLTESLVRLLKNRLDSHTAILYGSRAVGEADADSDYDVAGFRARGGPERIVRMVGGIQLDAFIYPDEKLDQPNESMLRLRGGKVLFEQGERATKLLRRLDEMYAAGPPRLPSDEIAARRAWAGKTLERIKAGDVEGNYRRAALLTALLEDYFHLRGRWFEGSKKSFAWLCEHDPETHALFEKSLKVQAPVNVVAALVGRVTKLPGRQLDQGNP
jgi:hypothetical protein